MLMPRPTQTGGLLRARCPARAAQRACPALAHAISKHVSCRWSRVTLDLPSCDLNLEPRTAPLLLLKTCPVGLGSCNVKFFVNSRTSQRGSDFQTLDIFVRWTIGFASLGFLCNLESPHLQQHRPDCC